MGGPGSGRWSWHRNKTTVESCFKLAIYTLKPCLQPGSFGNLAWSRMGRQTGAISFRVTGSNGQPEAIQLYYTSTLYGGEPQEHDYPVRLQTTPLPWGGVRYWFTCPQCGRRVGCLYLPPSARYFACRRCYNLTYQSCNESHTFDGFYADFAAMWAADYPGITPKLAGELIKFAVDQDKKPSPALQRFLYERWVQMHPFDYRDPYEQYLTRAELCEQSGLTPGDLQALESVRLLLPDHEGKYRPKLAGWGRKLACLLDEGWNLDELKAWACGRWSTPDPRAWPPEREAWQA